MKIIHSGNSLKNSDKIEKVLAIYNYHNLVQRSKELINKYIDEAVATLNDADISQDSRDFFAQLALRTTNRTN